MYLTSYYPKQARQALKHGVKSVLVNQDFDWSGLQRSVLCAALPPTISQSSKFSGKAGCRSATTGCPSISIQMGKELGVS